MPHHVRFWVYDGILASGAQAPIDVLAVANSLAADQSGPAFEWRVESPDGKPVRTTSGQLLPVDGMIAPEDPAAALVLCAPFVSDMAAFVEAPHLRPLYAGLRRQHAAGALLASCCTGSYLLAEAGLLDGRIATTHWRRAKEFARRYPRVRLQAQEVVTEEDGIICAGAVTAYLNLALRIVERLEGETLADATARLMLVDVNRGSQAPYVTPALEVEPPPADRAVARAQAYMRTHLDRRFRLAELAQELGLSERTLSRRFKLALGEGPLRHLQSIRIAAAKERLAAGHGSVEVICHEVGYEDLSAFRELFRRETGLSPRDYQQRFGRNQLAPRMSDLPSRMAKAPLPSVTRGA